MKSMNRENFTKMVIACQCYCNLNDMIENITGGYGLIGEDVHLLVNILEVTRDYSIYANPDGDDEDETLYPKFATIVLSDLPIEEKVDILLGNIEDPFKDQINAKKIFAEGSNLFSACKIVLEEYKSHR